MKETCFPYQNKVHKGAYRRQHPTIDDIDCQGMEQCVGAVLWNYSTKNIEEHESTYDFMFPLCLPSLRTSEAVIAKSHRHAAADWIVCAVIICRIWWLVEPKLIETNATNIGFAKGLERSKMNAVQCMSYL